MPLMNNSVIYQRRRNQLALQIREKTGGGIAIISTAPESIRNRDSDFPYRHDSDFFYLTGFDEPSATLVLIVSKDSQESHLFCRSKDPDREIWDGIRLGPAMAPEVLGIDFAYSNQELDKQLTAILSDQKALYIRLADSAKTDRQIRHWIHQVRLNNRSGINPPSEFHDIDALIHEMRLFKDAPCCQNFCSSSLSSDAHMQTSNA